MKLFLIFVLAVLTVLSLSILNAANTGDIEATANDSTIADNGSEIASNSSGDRLSSVSLASVYSSGLQRPLLLSARIREARTDCIGWKGPTAFFLILLALISWMLVEAF